MLLKNLIDYIQPPPPIELPQLPANFLASMIEVEDRKPEISRLSEDSDYVHVSSLIDLCPRQYAIARAHKLHLTSTPTSCQRVVWEMGKTLEQHVIKQIKSYHGEQFVITNYNIKNEEYKIAGTPDIMVTIGDKSVVVVECKSMNKRDFELLTRPLGDHILQAALYRWLVEQQGVFIPHNHVILLYIAKDYLRHSPYKEFHINIDDVTVQNGVTEALNLATELKRAREGEYIPRRHVCERQDCARSKECPVSHLCWSLPSNGN